MGVPERFLHQAVDVTCSTMFPFSSLADWSLSPEFRSGPAPIWMQVEFTAKAQSALLQRNTRAQLSAAIDRDLLSTKLFGGVVARRSVLATTWRSSGGSGTDTAPDRVVSPLPYASSAIRLAFYDYYPNREVAEFLRNSWQEQIGWDVVLVPVPFDAPNAVPADLRLELRYPTFPDPVAELESAMAMLGRIGSTEDKTQAAELFHFLKCDGRDVDESLLVSLAKLLDEAVPVIPLIALRHHCLVSPCVRGFHLPYLGDFDYRSLLIGETEID